MPGSFRKQYPAYVLSAKFVHALRVSVITHQALAASVGLHPEHFSRIFHGAQFGPRRKVKLEQAAAHFDLPADKAFRRVR